MKNKSPVYVIVLLAIAFTLISCSGGNNQSTNSTIATSVPSNSNEEIVADFGSVKLTQGALDGYLKLKRISPQDKDRVQRAKDEYIQRLALAEAVANTQYIDQELVNAEMAEFRNQMLVSRYFESYLNDKVSDQSIQNFYNTHPDEFQVEKVAVSHILIRTNPAMTEAERKALMTKATEAYSKARSGADFGKLALQYSDDKLSAKKGGSLGWINQGAIDPAFSKKVFSMQTGDISEPFTTPFGYHIIKVDEAKQVVKVPFEKVKGDIRYRLRQQARDVEMQRLLELVKSDKTDAG